MIYSVFENRLEAGLV